MTWEYSPAGSWRLAFTACGVGGMLYAVLLVFILQDAEKPAGQVREEGFHFLLPYLLGMNPLAGTIVVKPQELLHPPPVGLNRAASQTAHLAGPVCRARIARSIRAVGFHASC